ncbi:MAG: hypothetical protein EHM20_00180 [Alphaproteobacteria bacterium]|nr:MAG: hypothetical protein EHM20_00180 [Alphaproteobacteria bacterium]
MKNYIGSKIIQAELSTLDCYKRMKYGPLAVVNLDDTSIEGYIVNYPPIGGDFKPYISWSPKDVFEKCYREIEDAEKSLINGFWG